MNKIKIEYQENSDILFKANLPLRHIGLIAIIRSFYKADCLFGRDDLLVLETDRCYHLFFIERCSQEWKYAFQIKRLPIRSSKLLNIPLKDKFGRKVRAVVLDDPIY